MTEIKLNQIFLGEIASVRNYGAFVRIPGCQKQGLIHRSQVSTSRVDDVADILQPGERVWCKVVNVEENNKIALSMKLVNQGNGQDLDPNGIDWQRDEQKRKTITPREKKPIALGAILNTTCKKCGTKGHLATDCFTMPGGKKYELVPEIETVETTCTQSSQVDPTQDQEKDNKSKKKKKDKKKRKKSDRQSSESSSQENSSDDQRKSIKKKKRKKEKSKKKHKEFTKKKRKTSEDSSDEHSNSAKVSSKKSKYS